ncbi:hypothetical protein [Prosthecomicrobium sp. N25]|uniref:hypothetical protein n=1 Tax=Prosthecomicrobium sp. N25 TaxID=3129254 RepID=UPI003077CDD4
MNARSLLRGPMAAGRRLVDAVPAAAVFAPAFGLAVAAAILANVAWRSEALGGRALHLAAVYGGGAALGGFVAWLAAALFAPRRPATRFLLMTVLAGGLALAGAATLAAMEVRSYHAAYHAPFPSRIWVLQQIGTLANVLGIFAVLGTRLCLPFGPLAAVLAGAAYAQAAARRDARAPRPAPEPAALPAIAPDYRVDFSP